MPFRSLELKIPPMLVWGLSAALAWVADLIAPGARFAFSGQLPAALVLAFLGLAIAVAGVVSFRRARTTVNPLDPAAATSLVVSGIYRRTRNPMYLGVLVMLLGWIVYLGNPVSLVAAPVFVVFLNRFQIAPEERMLATLFSADFARYRARVRRWI